MAIGEAAETASLIGYLGKATQWGRELWAPGEKNGGIPVNIQDQTSKALDLPFVQPTAPFTTLAADAFPEDRTITVASTTGFIDGAAIIVASPAGAFYQGEQVGVAVGNVITLDTPLDVKCLTGCNVVVGTIGMNIDGSSTTQIFQIGPVGIETGIAVDITRIMGYIQSGVAMDDSTFGGLPALEYGIVLRNHNSEISNIWNVKTNGEIGLLCFDSALSNRAPAGSFGFRFRNTYAGQTKHGVALRLLPGDTLEVLIQDNLTGLEVFTMMAQGHYVTD
jgi:hypothetical protein